MFGRFGWAEILVIVVLVLILFGHNKIPGMMKNLADGINIFKKELKDKDTKSKQNNADDEKVEKSVKVKARKTVAKKKTTKATKK